MALFKIISAVGTIMVTSISEAIAPVIMDWAAIIYYSMKDVKIEDITEAELQHALEEARRQKENADIHYEDMMTALNEFYKNRGGQTNEKSNTEDGK